jgi:hypothetical protein
LPRERIGISLQKYTPWTTGDRNNQGEQERLVKSRVKITKEHNKKPFFDSINELENVHWKINAQVAEVSKQLQDELINTEIDLINSEGMVVSFDTIDIN